MFYSHNKAKTSSDWWKHTHSLGQLLPFGGERWVATLSETRNKNEARDAGLQNANRSSANDTRSDQRLFVCA